MKMSPRSRSGRAGFHRLGSGLGDVNDCPVAADTSGPIDGKIFVFGRVVDGDFGPNRKTLVRAAEFQRKLRRAFSGVWKTCQWRKDSAHFRRVGPPDRRRLGRGVLSWGLRSQKCLFRGLPSTKFLHQ